MRDTMREVNEDLPDWILNGSERLMMRYLGLAILLLTLIPTSLTYAQNALGDGHALDGGLNTRGTRNEPTRAGDVAPGQSARGLVNPNIATRLSTNSDFSKQNFANPGAFMESGGGIGSNPWYWQQAGTLEGQMMGGGYGGAGGGLGGGVSARYFSKDSNGFSTTGTYSPFFNKNFGDAKNRVAFGSDLDSLDKLNQISNRYIPSGQPGNVLQSEGATTPDDFNEPWQYTIGGGSPFLRDTRRGELMRQDLTNRELKVEPQPVGSGISPNQQMIQYTASNLLGLGAIFTGADASNLGLTNYDRLRSNEDEAEGLTTKVRPGRPYETRFPPNLMEGRRMTNRISEQQDPGRSPQVESIVEKMAQRYKELNPDKTDDLVGRFEQNYSQVQREISQYQIQPRLDRMAEVEALDEEDDELTEEGPDLPVPPRPEDRTPGGIQDSNQDDDVNPLNFDDIGLVLRHGQRVDSLSTGNQTRFDELMLAGQDKLKSGEYFWAEKRFGRALRFTPGHPLATAGLAHSQIGAGLNLTAALTLKSLLGFQPEMIDVVYDPMLLPKMDDLEQAIDFCRARIDEDQDLDDFGFLLAYLGHQLDRPELIREGLNAMSRANQDLVFLDILTRVWLPEVDIQLPPMVLPEKGVELKEVQIEPAQPAEQVEETIELVPLIEP